MLVEAIVDGRGVDGHVRMLARKARKALRGADQEQPHDVAAARFLEQVDGGDERAARGQHGVEDHGAALVDLLGQLDVVAHRLEGFLVAVHADHADLGPGNHVQHAVHHAEPGPQDGHDRDLLAHDAVHFHGAGPAVDGHFFGGQGFGGLVGEQAGDFAGQFAKFLGGAAVFAQMAEFVAHQGMIDDSDGHGLLLAFEVCGRWRPAPHAAVRAWTSR